MAGYDFLDESQSFWDVITPDQWNEVASNKNSPIDPEIQRMFSEFITQTPAPSNDQTPEPVHSNKFHNVNFGDDLVSAPADTALSKDAGSDLNLNNFEASSIGLENTLQRFVPQSEVNAFDAIHHGLDTASKLGAPNTEADSFDASFSELDTTSQHDIPSVGIGIPDASFMGLDTTQQNDIPDAWVDAHLSSINQTATRADHIFGAASHTTKNNGAGRGISPIVPKEYDEEGNYIDTRTVDVDYANIKALTPICEVNRAGIMIKLRTPDGRITHCDINQIHQQGFKGKHFFRCPVPDCHQIFSRRHVVVRHFDKSKKGRGAHPAEKTAGITAFDHPTMSTYIFGESRPSYNRSNIKKLDGAEQLEQQRASGSPLLSGQKRARDDNNVEFDEQQTGRKKRTRISGELSQQSQIRTERSPLSTHTMSHPQGFQSEQAARIRGLNNLVAAYMDVLARFNVIRCEAEAIGVEDFLKTIPQVGFLRAGQIQLKITRMESTQPQHVIDAHNANEKQLAQSPPNTAKGVDPFGDQGRQARPNLTIESPSNNLSLQLASVHVLSQPQEAHAQLGNGHESQFEALTHGPNPVATSNDGTSSDNADLGINGASFGSFPQPRASGEDACLPSGNQQSDSNDMPKRLAQVHETGPVSHPDSSSGAHILGEAGPEVRLGA